MYGSYKNQWSVYFGMHIDLFKEFLSDSLLIVHSVDQNV
jgi:hypothetical protein